MRSRLVAVDVFVLLHAAQAQGVHVFGPLPGVSGQRGATQAQAQQPVRHTAAVTHVEL